MRVRLLIKGPSVADLVIYLERDYGWIFSGFEQTDSMSGWADGLHEMAHEFVGFGINDGTYCSGVIRLPDE